MTCQTLWIRSGRLLLALCALATAPAWATTEPGHPARLLAQASTSDMAEGEVRKIDMERGRVTLKHGEIKALDMPPMTMVFVVKDKAMLERVKAGDKVRFKAVNEGGSYTITEIQPVK
jgi:Cu(I)/Ag(I) efflux system periplasmic protein CusF